MASADSEYVIRGIIFFNEERTMSIITQSFFFSFCEKANSIMLNKFNKLIEKEFNGV